MKTFKLGIERSPGGEHCADHRLEHRLAVDQLADARVKPAAADRANLQAKAASAMEVATKHRIGKIAGCRLVGA